MGNGSVKAESRIMVLFLYRFSDSVLYLCEFLGRNLGFKNYRMDRKLI